MAGVGNTQIIGGQEYPLYSPEWYAARNANTIKQAGVAGTAAGTAGNAALTALGNVTGATGAGTAPGSPAGSSVGLPAKVPSFAGGASPGGAPVSSPGGVGGGSGVGAPSVAPIAPIDMKAADSAAFGRAKDQVGQTSAGALSGLRSALGGRGLLGSGAELRGTTGVVNAGQQQLGDVSREQAINDVEMNLDVAKTNQGAALAGRGQDIGAGVATRGQDIGAQTAGYSGQIAQRGQDIQYAESQAQNALTSSLAQAAQRQQILQGIMGAINGSTLY